MNYKEYYDNFRERLEKASNPGLIYCLNQQVGNQGSGVAKSAYLKAIHDQLDLRRIDYSEIGNSQSLSFAKRVLLKDNKLTLMNETIKDKIIFLDTDEFDVTFTTLLIRVDRTIEILGSLQKFQEIYGHNIWTNGRLIILKEMSSPAAELEQIMVEKFIPIGFEIERDFVFLEEQLIYGAGDRVTPYINKPIPGSENTEWLESEVRLEGNFVKFRPKGPHKKDIENKLKDIQSDLQDYLDNWKKNGGGTKGHAIGSMIERMKALRDFFKTYC